MANPFFVQSPQYGQGLQSLAQGVQQFGQQRQEEQRRAEAEAYKQRAKQAMAEAFQSGDPMAIRQAVIEYPEIAETATQMFGFTNAQTERAARDAYRRALSDPANADRYIQQGIEQVSRFGGQPTNMMRDLEMLQNNPEQALQNIRLGYAAIASEQEFNALQGDGVPNIGQYNPRDYTTESFAEFVRTRDPSVLQRYASQQSVDIGGVPHVFDPTIGGYRPAGVAGTQGAQPVTAQTVAESEATIAGERTRATEQARQDVEAGSPQERRQMAEAQQTAQQNIANFQGIVDQADLLLENDEYVEAMSGVSGKIPALPGTARYDAQVAFNQFKDTLTLGNLDKMSGVLTDRDIQVLASAAGGIEPGMSKEALVDRLNRIKRVFESKTASERKKLEEFMAGEAGDIEAVQPSIDDLINKYSD